MSDLISRKLVLDKLKDFSDMYTLEEEARIVLETIVRIVTEQPTAYSVGKVVAELEEEAKDTCMQTDCSRYRACCECRGVENAIKVVRKGGVE